MRGPWMLRVVLPPRLTIHKKLNEFHSNRFTSGATATRERANAVLRLLLTTIPGREGYRVA